MSIVKYFLTQVPGYFHHTGKYLGSVLQYIGIFAKILKLVVFCTMWMSESAACAWMSHVYVGMSGCQGSAIQIQPHIWNTSHARVPHEDFFTDI